VNRAFYDSARYFRDRNQTFFLEGIDGKQSTYFCPISAARLEALLSGPLSNVRTLRYITISSRVVRRDRQTLPQVRDILDSRLTPNHSVSNELKFAPIARLIAKTPKLKSLTFEAYEQIPLCIMEALQCYHPNAELHIRNWTRTSQGEGHNDPAELALSQSPNLRSIEANMGNREAGFDLRRPALRRIVALAPSLEMVDISNKNTTNSFPHFEPVSEMWLEQQRRSDHFKVANPSSNSVKILKSQGGDDVSYLSNVTALEMLETLEVCHNPFVFGYQVGASFTNNNQENRFPSLKHLSVKPDVHNGWRWLNARQALTSFLMNLQPLRSLQLSNCAHLLPAYTTFLFHHGAHLRILILHEAETQHGRGDKRPIEVDQIWRNCPNLMEIGIDIDTSVDGAEELDILRQLAKFPFLATIGLHFGLTRNQFTVTNPFHRGYLGKTLQESSWVENIWGVLREHKTKHESAALQKVVITMGELNCSIPRGITEFWIKWEAENRVQIVATPSDRDDGANEIVVITKVKEKHAVRIRRQIPLATTYL